MEYVEALEILKLSEGFCDEDLKKAYKSASKIYHPDLGGSTEMMQKVNEAYDLLLKEPRYIHITKSYNAISYHVEWVMQLKEKLADAKKNDPNYIEIMKVIQDFENMNITGMTLMDIHREFVNANSKILDIFYEIKRKFFKENYISKDFKYEIDFTSSLNKLYYDLDKIKCEFDHYVYSSIVINEVVKKNVGNFYYKFLEDKVMEICNQVCKEYFDSKSILDKINIINNKVNGLYVIFEDSLNVIDNLKLVTNNSDLIKREIDKMNNDYYSNYGRLNELLVNVSSSKKSKDIRKSIKIKEYVICKYMNNNELLRRMLLDIHYVNIGLIKTECLDVILDKNYDSVDEYNEAIYKHIGKSDIIFVNNKLITNYSPCVGVLQSVFDNQVCFGGKLMNKKIFYNHYESLSMMLRDAEFIGELLNTGEVLLYTNNIIAIYKGNDGIYFKFYDKKRGKRINHPDIDKYKDKILLRNEIINYLNDEVTYENDRLSK